jgi:molybdopterin-containing oxidoreductase family iron-sulfur binding subunit
MDRRKFLKTGGCVLLAGATSAYGVRLLTATESKASNAVRSASALRWGMVIDLNECKADCDACTTACRTENNVAFHGDERWDVHRIRMVKIKSKESPDARERPVPLLCNHCDEAPCVQVCPVKATYKRHDGIVIIDHHRCMGCRYCMIACPYNARFFNYKENHEWHNTKFPKRSHGVAESCDFCAHLLDAGKTPACVAACKNTGGGALHVGNLNDPNSEVSMLIEDNITSRLREDFGTKPKVYYIGL